MALAGAAQFSTPFESADYATQSAPAFVEVSNQATSATNVKLLVTVLAMNVALAYTMYQLTTPFNVQAAYDARVKKIQDIHAIDQEMNYRETIQNAQHEAEELAKELTNEDNIREKFLKDMETEWGTDEQIAKMEQEMSKLLLEFNAKYDKCMSEIDLSLSAIRDACNYMHFDIAARQAEAAHAANVGEKPFSLKHQFFAWSPWNWVMETANETPEGNAMVNARMTHCMQQWQAFTRTFWSCYASYNNAAQATHMLKNGMMGLAAYGVDSVVNKAKAHVTQKKLEQIGEQVEELTKLVNDFEKKAKSICKKQ